MRNLRDTLLGLIATVLYVGIYDHWPRIAIGALAFQMGVQVSRWTWPPISPHDQQEAAK